MKRLVLFLAVIALFCSCKKEYKYVEQVNLFSFEDVEFTNRTEKMEIIKAKNDTLAYQEAYTKFMISMKVSNEMEKTMGTPYSKPKSFSLYKDDKLVLYTGSDKYLEQIKNRIMGMDLGMEDCPEIKKINEQDLNTMRNFKNTYGNSEYKKVVGNVNPDSIIKSHQ